MAVAGLRNVSVFDSQHDQPSNRASTLLQIWREIEGEHLATQSCELRPQRSGSGPECSRSHSMCTEQGNDNEDDVSQDSDDIRNRCFSILEIDHEDNNSIISEQSSDLGEVERERVRQIFKEWMSSGSKGGLNVKNRSGQWLGGNERERVRVIREWVQKTSQQRNNCGSDRDGDGDGEVGSEIEQVRDGLVIGHTRRTNRRLCGRQTLIDLVLRIQDERKREILGLSEQRPVSNFAHRNRIQALLKGRFLRNERLVPDERPSSRAETELGLLRQRQTVSDLREEFLSKLDSSASTLVSTDSPSTSASGSNGKSAFESQEKEDTELQVASGSGSAADGFRIILESEVQITEAEDSVMNDEGMTEEQEPIYNQSTYAREEPATNIDGRQQELFIDTEHNSYGDQSTAVISNEPLLGSEEIYLRETVEVFEHVQQRMGAGQALEVNGQNTEDEENGNEEFESQDSSPHRDGFPESVIEIDDAARSWLGSSSNQWTPETLNDNNDDQYQRQGSHQDWRSYDSQEGTDSWLDSAPSREVGESSGRHAETYFHHNDGEDVRRIELRELFSRRRVSSLLHSGFRESLDRVLQLHAERLGNASDDWEHDDTSEDFVEQDQEHLNGNQTLPESYGFETNPLSAPSPTFIAASQPFWGEEFPSANWSRRMSSQLPGTEWDVINELRIDIARLNQRMNSMQSMLEECMDMQIELQRSVRQEVSAALNRAISSRGTGKAPRNQIHGESEPWNHVRKGVCCLCNDGRKIDSLLYRCGHMCTCSKCAETLVQSNGKCPMCQAPVVEAVRAYFIQ